MAVFGNLLWRKKFQKEALVLACEFESKEHTPNIVFTETDLQDYNPDNLIGQINSLSQQGFIKFEHVDYNFCDRDTNEQGYLLTKLGLTVEGEKLLRSFSLISKMKPIIIGAISGLLSAYLAIKLGIIT